MLLGQTNKGDVVLVGKDRAYAIGDTAYIVGTARESSIESSIELLPVSYMNDQWVRSTTFKPFRRDKDTEVTVIESKETRQQWVGCPKSNIHSYSVYLRKQLHESPG